jgi:glyoxylase-like metal-dependent hydrolase (beta-lactamase superfamily II)
VRVERCPVGPFDNNLYLLTSPGSLDAIVVDPCGDDGTVLAEIRRRGLSIRRILLTHAHIDHILAVKAYRGATGAPVWLHAGDRWWLERAPVQASLYQIPWDGPFDVDHWITEGEEVGLPGIEAKALHTPGHSPGSMTFATAEGLIVGDVLFAGSIGRSDLPLCDPDALVRSVREHLFAFPDDTHVYPGHGPATTIGAERRTNPFVGDAALGSRQGA